MTGGLHLLEFLTLCQTILTGLRGLAALTSECACSTAATATAAACRTVARSAIATLETAAVGIGAATETVATACRALTATLTRTMLAPLARLRAGALTRTTAETTTLAATLTRAAATTAFAIVVGARTVHRMRTWNVTRCRGTHALLAAERIVARTRTRSVRLRTIGGIVAIAALRSIGIVALCARSRNRSRLAALTAFALRTRSVTVGAIAMLAGITRTRHALAGLRASDLDAAGRAGFGAAGFAADAAGAAGVARGAGVGEAAGQPASWPGPQASWIRMRCPARWKRKHSSAYGQPEVQR